MRPPEDEVLLRDMLDRTWQPVPATEGTARSDLGNDGVLAAALERFIEVIDEAASKTSNASEVNSKRSPGARSSACATPPSSPLFGPRRSPPGYGLPNTPAFKSGWNPSMIHAEKGMSRYWRV